LLGLFNQFSLSFFVVQFVLNPSNLFISQQYHSPLIEVTCFSLSLLYEFILFSFFLISSKQQKKEGCFFHQQNRRKTKEEYFHFRENFNN